MAQEEVVDGSVPVSCKLIPGHRIPPVGIETPIRKVGEFGQEIEDAFPNDIPTLIWHCVSGLRECKSREFIPSYIQA
jgi:hypothetical protein